MDSSNEMKPQVEPDHYYSLNYDSRGRFCTYWHQVDEIIKLGPNKVLEIGTGSGFVSKYLKERKTKVTTLDIDERLNPDVAGSVLELPFANGSFEVIACYEVLEHLPYEWFDHALSEIRRISTHIAILSLPDIGRVYRINVQIPKIGETRKLIPFPRIRKPAHNFDAQHYWEIGKLNYPLDKITNDIKKVGFKIERTYRVFEMPCHRFFILQKIGRSGSPIGNL